LPEKFKSLSVSWNELRDEGFGNHPWTMPRNMKGTVTVDIVGLAHTHTCIFYKKCFA
jgi:hypothetical protein